MDELIKTALLTAVTVCAWCFAVFLVMAILAIVWTVLFDPMGGIVPDALEEHRRKKTKNRERFF